MQWVLLMLTVAALLYVAVGYAIANRLTTAKRRTCPEHVKQHQSISFVSRGDSIALRGSLAYSATPSHRALILVHGRNACQGWEFNASSQGLVQELLENGFDVLMFDLRGHGQSAAARLTFGLREHQDVLGAVDFLKARGYQNKHIALLGMSVGAVSALLASRQEPAIGAVIADSGFADFQTIIKHQFKHLSGLPDFFLAGGLLLGRVFKPVQTLNPSTPTLVIHAQGDNFIPSGQAALLASATQAQTWLVQGEQHLAAYRNEPETYTARVVQFLETHLPKTQHSENATKPPRAAMKSEFVFGG
jgi:uncharacterized protein